MHAPPVDNFKLIGYFYQKMLINFYNPNSLKTSSIGMGSLIQKLRTLIGETSTIDLESYL